MARRHQSGNGWPRSLGRCSSLLNTLVALWWILSGLYLTYCRLKTGHRAPDSDPQVLSRGEWALVLNVALCVVSLCHCMGKLLNPHVHWSARSSTPLRRAAPKPVSLWPALMHTVLPPGCRTLCLFLLNMRRFLKHLLACWMHSCNTSGCPCTRSLVPLGTLALHTTTCRTIHLMGDKKGIQSFLKAKFNQTICSIKKLNTSLRASK